MERCCAAARPGQSHRLCGVPYPGLAHAAVVALWASEVVLAVVLERSGVAESSTALPTHLQAATQQQQQ